jgi:small subunit ribosomal protein S17
MSEENKNERNQRRRLQGIVVSDKMDKTITVQWERQVKHPHVGKYIKRRKKLHAHDEENKAHVGDMVEIEATRPLSKTKTWRLVKVIREAHAGLKEKAAAAGADVEV